jgi:hypothetical protein
MKPELLLKQAFKQYELWIKLARESIVPIMIRNIQIKILPIEMDYEHTELTCAFE